MGKIRLEKAKKNESETKTQENEKKIQANFNAHAENNKNLLYKKRPLLVISP